MNIKYPDYKNSIANLACSILKYYGIEPPNPTLPQADMLLDRKYKNIVVILLDGMGTSSLEKHLPKNGFFRRNLICSYSSTFPPTTVAATTAIESGLFPNQSAWLGWTGYFEEIDKNIVYFLNTDSETGEKIEINAADTFVPYEKIRDIIAASGTDTYYIMPFAEPYPKSYNELCNEIKRLCAQGDRKYIYAYWDEPDKSMHENGVDGEDIGKLISELENTTEQLAAELSDTLLIVTADHGHINVRNKILTDYEDITECLLRMPSMEPRAVNFFIKNGMEKQFAEAFNRHFGDDFLLLSKSELLEKKLLGIGKAHDRLEKMLGDFLAVGISDTAICNKSSTFKGNHAGLTEEEMTIPLIAVKKVK